MIDTATSKNGVAIRLTEERWDHITDEHGEMAGLHLEVLEAISDPIRVVAGGEGELLAVRELELGKYVVVVYRELGDDGFVITAFLTRRIKSLEMKKTAMAIANIEEYLKLLPTLTRSPSKLLWSSYDTEADTLYINFKKPSQATDSEITDDDVIIRYENGEVVGLTILHASTR